MGGQSRGLDLTATFDALSADEAGAIVTTNAEIAGWARRHGYLVRTGDHSGCTIYEIRPGGTGPADAAGRR
jgi:hypothetical protein